MLISPTDEEKTDYETLNQLQDEIIKKLKPDMQLSKVYEFAIAFLKEKRPNIPQNQYPQSFGYGVGLENTDPFFQISADCNRTVLPGMCFNVQVAFDKLGGQSKKYAIWLSDTVVV